MWFVTPWLFDLEKKEKQKFLAPVVCAGRSVELGFVTCRLVGVLVPSSGLALGLNEASHAP